LQFAKLIFLLQKLQITTISVDLPEYIANASSMAFGRFPLNCQMQMKREYIFRNMVAVGQPRNSQKITGMRLRQMSDAMVTSSEHHIALTTHLPKFPKFSAVSGRPDFAQNIQNRKKNPDLSRAKSRRASG
jgi:hypothetical protein